MSFFASRAARTKRSISFFDQSAAFTAGAAGFRTGLYAQKSRPASSVRPTCFFDTAPVRGSGAPIFTHCSKSATTASGSLPFGGIFRSSSYRMLLRRRLSDGFFGSKAGPLSPPARRPSRESRSRPPLSFLFAWASAEWHWPQCSTRTGRIFFSKNATCSGVGGAGGGAAARTRGGGDAGDPRTAGGGEKKKRHGGRTFGRGGGEQGGGGGGGG